MKSPLDHFIRENRRFTTRELCTELSVGFNALEYRKVCGRWFSRMLTQEHNYHRMQTCQDLLDCPPICPLLTSTVSCRCADERQTSLATFSSQQRRHRICEKVGLLRSIQRRYYAPLIGCTFRGNKQEGLLLGRTDILLFMFRFEGKILSLCKSLH
jgi:hypothetical protein